MPISSHWRICGASAKGHGHERCQDAFAWHFVNAQTGIAIVADGAGSYATSHLGSTIAARGTKRLFQQMFQDVDIHTLDEKQWRKHALKMVVRLRSILRQVAAKKSLPLSSLSTTLIVLIFTPSRLLSLHIGDGRAGYADKRGEWHAVMTPFKGTQAGETVFLTTPWIIKENRRYIETTIVDDEISAVTVLSDGAETGSFECLQPTEAGIYVDKNRPYPGFFNPVVKWVATSETDFIHTEWKKFLHDGTPVFANEPDDKTMIVAVRHA